MQCVAGSPLSSPRRRKDPGVGCRGTGLSRRILSRPARGLIPGLGATVRGDLVIGLHRRYHGLVKPCWPWTIASRPCGGKKTPLGGQIGILPQQTKSEVSRVLTRVRLYRGTERMGRSGEPSIAMWIPMAWCA
jgi:hypothetical protein